MRLMIRLRLAVSLCGLLTVPVRADDVADFTDALGKVATGVIVAEAYMSACEAPRRFRVSRVTALSSAQGSTRLPWKFSCPRFPASRRSTFKA